jgi:hypothetical protein
VTHRLQETRAQTVGHPGIKALPPVCWVGRSVEAATLTRVYHLLIMHLPQMEPMSFWELVKNSPEWAGVISSTAFAIVTTVVIIWQVRVMRWQGRNSERHEYIQNRLIRLQHEHEWLLRLNAEREKILAMARKLHLIAGCLKERQQAGDVLNWEELQDKVFELSERLRVLDVRAYSGAYDSKWSATLTLYVNAVLKAVIDDGKFNVTYAQTNAIPNVSTRKALEEANDTYSPTGIFLDLETAIRMEFGEFKDKWDAELPF